MDKIGVVLPITVFPLKGYLLKKSPYQLLPESKKKEKKKGSGFLPFLCVHSGYTLRLQLAILGKVF